MTRLSIDDQVSEIRPASGEKLGDVLQEVVAQLPPDRVVKGISVDGRELPKHEELEALGAGIDGIQELGIKTVDRAVWARNGLDIALTSIERIQKSLLRAADLLRDDNVTEGGRYLTHCVEGLERFLETVTVTRVALQLDFAQLRADDRSLAQLEKEFSQILKGIVVAREKQDWQAVADRVEDEMLMNCSFWTKALAQLRKSQSSNA